MDDSQVKAPEGGWGYVVSLALVINFVCCFSPANSFGMLYGGFFDSIGATTGEITTTQSVTFITMAFSGIFTNVMLKKFSVRQVGVFGSILYISSWLVNYYITSIYHMIFSSILAGMGIIIVTTVTFATFNTYFVEKRMMILSICQMGVGTGTMLFPLVLEMFLAEFGFRGTLLVMTALVSNTILATLCLHPVEWHAKKISEYIEILPEESPVVGIDTAVIEMGSDEDNTQSNFLAVPQTKTPSASRKSSMMLEPRVVEVEEKVSKWRKIIDFMDISLLGDMVYLNITVGIGFSIFSDMGFFMIFPLFLYTVGLSTAQVAFCLTLVAAADLLSRAIIAVISKFHQFPSRDIYFVTVIGSVISKLVFMHCNSYWSFMITTFIMGLFRGPLMLAIPLVYAEYAPDKFAAAYGLSILFMGVTNTVMFPVIGFIRDLTASYGVAFYTIILLSFICIIPWTYEYWYFKKKKPFTSKK